MTYARSILVPPGSPGTYHCGHSGDTLKTLLQRADECVCRAKSAGRKRVVGESE